MAIQDRRDSTGREDTTVGTDRTPTSGLKPMLKIRFLKAWGHPTRNEVYGPPQVVIVSQWIADNLIGGGYAELVLPE